MYLYITLKEVRNEIRLLKLHPGTRNDPLVCSLVTSSLDDNPSYDALSYMWGSPELTETMAIDQNAQMRIRLNLAKALRCIRNPNNYCILWVDALCINQQDVEERNTQVSIMRKIYTQATAVRVYIDRSILISDAVYQMLQNLSEKGDGSSLGDDSSIWHPVAHLLQDKYWERLWIQQELVLAKKIVIHCNSTQIDGGALMAFQTLLLRRAHPELQFSNPGHKRGLSQPDDWTALSNSIALTMVPSKHLLWWRKMREQKQPILLLELVPPSELSELGAQIPWQDWENKEIIPVCLFGAMRVAARLKVTDPRDRVYGILGLVIDVESGDIPIDYTKTEAEVQTDVARFLLRKTRKLMFLPHAGLDNDLQADGSQQDALRQLSSPSPIAQAPNLSRPSWIPRWTGESLFWATAHASASIKFATSTTISTDGKTLTVQGMKIGHIPPSSLSISFRTATLLDLAIFLICTIPNSLQGRALGATIRTTIENLGKTLIKPGIAIKQTTSDLADEEYFLYMLLLLKWGIVTEDGQARNLGDVGRLSVRSAEEFNKVFKFTYASRANDPSLLALVDLQQIVSDGIMPRRWEKFNEFISFLETSCNGNSCISVTEKGDFVLLGDAWIDGGDEIWIVFGCTYPMVLRPVGEGEDYVVVSPASMYGTIGFMEGLYLRASVFGVEGMFDGTELRELQEQFEDGKTAGGYVISTIQLT
jgi:hypothetical protein